jgi:hypothetical protein
MTKSLKNKVYQEPVITPSYENINSDPDPVSFTTGCELDNLKLP